MCVPSHLGLGLNDPRPKNVSHLDVLANDRADHFAGLAAEQVQVSNPISTNHIYILHQASGNYSTALSPNHSKFAH